MTVRQFAGPSCRSRRSLHTVKGLNQDRKKGTCKQIIKTVLPTPETANAALNRVEIPQDAADRIARLLTPGSSLIISDHGISGETGQDTDFIVLTR